MPNYRITSPVQSSGYPHKIAIAVYSSGISGYHSFDWDRLMGKFDDIIENTNQIEINVSGINVDIVDPTGAGLLQSGVDYARNLSGKLGEVTGLLLTNNINLFDTTLRLSGVSGILNQVTGKLATIHDYLQTGILNMFDGATGSSIISFAVVTSGTRRLDDAKCKKAVFINQRVAQYRVYKNDETGLSYDRWLPVNSGGWDKRLEIAGITTLNSLAVQSDSTSVTSFSGDVLVYM